MSALIGWNPAWASNATYECEPPTLDNSYCYANFYVYYDMNGSLDCSRLEHLLPGFDLRVSHTAPVVEAGEVVLALVG